MPLLSNLRRNMVAAREAFDAETGSKVLRGKPRFELLGGRLEMRNVPVPKEYFARVSGPDPTDTPDTFVARCKTRLSTLPGMWFLKKIVYFFVPWESFPEFRDSESPEWQLMEGAASSKAREIIQSSSSRPSCDGTPCLSPSPPQPFSLRFRRRPELRRRSRSKCVVEISELCDMIAAV